MEQQVNHLAARLPALGISSYSHDLALTECRFLQMSALSPLRSAEQNRAISETCLRLAKDVLNASPVNAYALYVAAYSANTLDQRHRSEDYLERSRALSPRESWLASLRLLLWRQRTSPLHTETGYRAAEDIRTLGHIGAGREWLARWYLLEEAARPLIRAALEEMPDRHKGAFVAAVDALGRPTE
jgi:hypothetical protein